MPIRALKILMALVALTIAGAITAAPNRTVVVGNTELFVPVAPGYADTKLIPDGAKEETVRIDPGIQLVVFA